LQRLCNAGGVIRREVFICEREREREGGRERERGGEEKGRSPRNPINLNVAT
jgi:hypothetical protein